MNRIRSQFCRPLRAAVVMLAVVAAGAREARAQEPAAAPAAKETAAKKTFPPEVEEKLAEYFKKGAEAKRRMLGERIQKELEEVVKLTGLGAEGKKAMEAAGQKAADQSAEDWAAAMADEMRQQWWGTSQASQLLRYLKQLLTQVEALAASDYGAYRRPEEEPAWTEALARTLTAEQAAAWKQLTTARREAKEKETGAIVKSSLERIRTQVSPPVEAKVGEIKSALSLSPERAQQLDKLAKSAIDQSMEAWRGKAERILLFASDTLRRQMIAQGQIYISWEEKDLPLMQSVWTEGLAAFLTASEQTRLAALREEAMAKRARVLGQVLLGELDARVAFTSAQRQQLRPITERLVRNEPNLMKENAEDNYRSLALQSFFGAASKATESEMKPILDATQWEHWKEACEEGKKAPEQGNGGGVKIEAGGDVPFPDPEEFENGMSDFFTEKSARKRKQLLAPMILQAEDAARVAGLAPEALSRLQVAGRGAAEEALGDWKSQTADNVRANLAGATAGDIRRRLANLENYYFNQRGGKLATAASMWEKTVKAELSEEQQAAWKKEVDARRADRGRSIAGAIMIEFDRKTQLTAEQWDKLEPMIANIVEDYSVELTSYFSYNEGMVWYLQYYQKFLPFAGVPEKEMKSILTKEQWDRWSGCQEFANSLETFEYFQRMHDQRKKQEKPEKPK